MCKHSKFYSFIVGLQRRPEFHKRGEYRFFSGRLRIFISTYLPTAPEAQYIDIRSPLSAGPL